MFRKKNENSLKLNDMKKNWILFAALLATSYMGAFADDFVDDIYYDPSKAKAKTSKKTQSSNYISDFNSMDVDAYNRRGQYYSSPIDTIGAYAESGEDFVYTQKIQKFYNPTIVVENSDLLASVLENSYGNVEVIYNINGPAFSSIYSPWGYAPASWYSPYYYPTNWGWSVGWNNPYWYGPSWSWNWGPSWSFSWNWGPSWAWGPSWGYGPGWGWGHHHHYYRPAVAYTPGRNRPLNYGWQPPRRGYTYGGGHSVGRPATSVSRPGSSHPVTVRPGGQVTRPNHQGAPSTRPIYSIGGNRGMTGNKGTTTSTPAGNRGTSAGSVVNNNNSVNSGRGMTTNRGSNSTQSVSRPSRNSSTSVSRPSGSSGRSSSAGSRSSGSRGASSGGRGGRR